MEYAIKLNVNQTVDIIKIPDIKGTDWYAKQIGCDWIEVVRPKYANDDYMLVLDEEGKLKDNCINLIASSMYGTFDHGDPIVGNCLLLAEKYRNGEIELCGFTYEKACEIKESIEFDMKSSKKFQDFIDNIMDEFE